MAIKTVITGCALYDPSEPRAVWGDLWASEDVWIFNACVDGKGEAAWDYEPVIHSELRYLELKVFFPIFERRGVIVAPKIYCRLSQAAELYLRRGA